MTLVGIIANPASGKDIRRLVAQATVIDNQAKVGIVQRALVGLEAMGVQRALIMPDSAHLGQIAMTQRHSRSGGVRLAAERPDHPLHVDLLDIPSLGDASDSVRAAEVLRAEGAACIITLGGDGTVRAVSKGAGDVPILPISTGTNNVLPTFVEGTVAGLVAGAVARGLVAAETVALRHKWLQVITEQAEDRALVDVAVVRGRFLGARALWNVDDILHIIVTRADPAMAGVSALAGMVRPLDPSEPRGLVVTLGPGGQRRILGLLAPGLIVAPGIEEWCVLDMGETWAIVADESLILALDGEREAVLQPGQRAAIRLRDDGPWLIDATAAMRAIALRGLLQDATSR